jgi:peptidoglycan-associated lipoprotein
MVALKRTEGYAGPLCGAILVLSLSACKQPSPQVPSAPAPKANTAPPAINSFKAEPATIPVGQTSVLTWSVENADRIRIEPEDGGVLGNDRRSVSPAKTTTYSLIASNSAGTVQAAVTVSVASPPPVPSQDAQQLREHLKIVNSQLRDIHFNYNGGDLSPEEEIRLREDATILSDLFRLDPNANVAVEGHCDARGSDEYNIALGDRRATAVKAALVSLGLPAMKLSTVSYGKERSVCDDDTEECYARNRRVHFSAGREDRATEDRNGR